MTAALRTTPERLASVSAQLTPAEWAVLDALARLRLASARQLERLHFTDGTDLAGARRSRRSLTKLVELGLLARLERRVGGVKAGSAGYVYALAPTGQHLLQVQGPAGRGGVRRPWTPGGPFLRHRLAVSELYVELVVAARQGELELVTFAAEPDSWRRCNGPHGGVVTLKPDAYVVIGQDEFEDSWFVEVDLATESPEALRRKCNLVRAYHASGREQARRGVFPLTMFLVPDEARATVVRRVIATQPASERELFRVGLLARGVRALTGGTS